MPFKASALRTRNALALVAALVALPMPAHAQWQAIHRAPDARSVDQCTGEVLRAAENRPLRVTAGSRTEIEVLGNGIDLVRDFDFDGGTVTWQGSHGGVENIARKCGPVGSVKLVLNVARANPELGAPAERNYTLRIGNERIRVTAILPAVIETFAWHRGSFRLGDRPLSPATLGSGGAPGTTTPPPTSPPTVNSGPSCIQTQTCGGGGTTAFAPPSTGARGGGSAADGEAQKSLAACIIGKGGDIRVVGKRLEIMLPDDRGAVRDCITAGSFAVASQSYDRPDIVPESRQIPALRFTTTGGPEATASVSLDPDRAKFSLTREFTSSMVGVRNFQLIATNFAQRSQTLDVRVQSVVPYGVTKIAPATSLAKPITTSVAGIGRGTAAPIVPTVGFDITLAPSDAAARPLAWQVLGPQGQPAPNAASCFAQTSGTLAPAAGTGQVTLAVPRVSGTACNGASFVLAIAPQGQSGSALYSRSTPFNLR